MSVHYLLSLLFLFAGICSVRTQCMWEFDLSFTQEIGGTFPPPKNLACNLFVSDTVRFLNSGTMDYYLVRIGSTAGFERCNLTAANVTESSDGPVLIPSGGELSLTLSRTSGRWTFLLGDEVYFITNGTDFCLTAAFTVLSDLNRTCDALPYNGLCVAPIPSSSPTPTPTTTLIYPTPAPTPTTPAPSMSSSQSIISSTITPTPTPTTPPPMPPTEPPLTTVNIVLVVSDVSVASLLIAAIVVLAVLIVLYLRRRGKIHCFFCRCFFWRCYFCHCSFCHCSFCHCSFCHCSFCLRQRKESSYLEMKGVTQTN